MNFRELLTLVVGTLLGGAALVCAVLALAWCGWRVEQCSSKLKYVAALCGVLLLCGLMFNLR